MSTSVRLNSVAPDLVNLGAGLSPKDRRAMAFRVARWACKKTDVLSYLEKYNLTALDGYSWQQTEGECRLLSNEIEELDEKYFLTQDERLDGPSSSESLRWFSKARALSSLQHALESQSIEAFCDALYEAHAATDDLAGLRQACL